MQKLEHLGRDHTSSGLTPPLAPVLKLDRGPTWLMARAPAGAGVPPGSHLMTQWGPLPAWMSRDILL